MTIFGDMDTSIIKSKPKNRIETITYSKPDTKINEVILFTQKQINNGNQVFWVCPLIEESKNKPNEISDTGLSRFDLLFVAIISVLSGILIALIYIQLKSKKDNKIKYDFIEAADNDSKIDGLPKGLSIENNHDEQQIDLAYTYYEMGNYEDAVKILNQIIKNSKITSIKTKAEELLAMIQK